MFPRFVRPWCDHAKGIVPVVIAAACLGICAGVRASDIPVVDNLVLNPGFDTDLAFWTVSTSGIDQWRAPDFSHASGYARIFVSPATAGDHMGPSQCLFLPRPAVYQLTGLARGLSLFGATNTARIHWHYLENADATCNASGGGSSGEGDVMFPATGSFEPPVADLRIQISPVQWNSTSAIEITLIGDTDVALANQNSVAAFDDIALTGYEIDEIYASGFEPFVPRT